MGQFEWVKKQKEEDQLLRFLGAYLRVTGRRIEMEESAERPDFLCRGPDGRRIGVEVTQVYRGDGPPPTGGQVEPLVDSGRHLWGDEAWDRIVACIDAKETERRKANWRLRSRAMLVINLLETPAAELAASAPPQHYFPRVGFQEIWLVDHAGIAAFDTVELFGIKPRRFWGYHADESRGKPYG